MRNGVHIETVSTAHIRIIPSGGFTMKEFDRLCDEINQKAEEVVSDLDGVEVDDEFCCQSLSEVGLRGTCPEAVTKAANTLADWAEAHRNLKLAEI